jgi:hypothetical protein
MADSAGGRFGMLADWLFVFRRVGHSPQPGATRGEVFASSGHPALEKRQVSTGLLVRLTRRGCHAFQHLHELVPHARLGSGDVVGWFGGTQPIAPGHRDYPCYWATIMGQHVWSYVILIM